MATKRCIIRRRLQVDAAHRIPDHASKCFNLHGHRYVIEADCIGPIITEGEQTGMVLDFSFLKACMTKAIYDPCDHGLILYDRDPMLAVLREDAHTTHDKYTPSEPEDTPAPDFVEGVKLLRLPYVPTAENLAMHWYTEVQKEIDIFFMDLPHDTPEVKCIRVWETPNCMAVYPATEL